MPERAPLLALLRQVRRRLRLAAAADGAIRGAALGLGALAVILAVARLRGVTPARPAVPIAAAFLAAGVVAAAVLGGALLLALRRIPLPRCARLVDRALDGQDRVLSALSFVSLPPGAPPATGLAEAAVADALARTRALSPAGIAPARRPRGLALLAAAGVAAAAAALVPGRAPAARLNVAGSRPPGPTEARLKIAAGQLDAERDEARRAAEAAAALDDQELAALAKDFSAALRALTDGTLTQGQALEQMKALAERAAEAAADAEARREALHAVGRALEESGQTRAAGLALGAEDAAGAERALGEAAARAAEASAAERNQIAQAMDAAEKAAASAAAAAAARTASGTTASGDPAATGAEAERQRRLKRDQPPPGAGQPPGAEKRSGDRKLERLRRDLAETAKACRENPEACKRRLSERAGDLPRMAREAQRVDVWRRVANAAKQARERMRRGDMGGRQNKDGKDGKDGKKGERAFTRAARGESSPGGDDAEAMIEDDEEGDEGLLMEGGDGQGGMELGTEGGEAEAAGSSPGKAAASSSAAARAAGDGANNQGDGEGHGEGIGHEAGRDPLGRPGALDPARGHEREARLRGTRGPTRAQVIEAAAQRGFAHGTYGRVFTDYQAVVEEALEAGAVPEGRRYVVRRYFQLIRPRTAAEPRPSAGGGGGAKTESARRP